MKVKAKKNKKPHDLKFAVIASDVCLFTVVSGELKVLLTPVNRPPYFSNMLGLPGGLVHPAETAEEAALRIAEKKGGIDLSDQYVEQLYTFSRLDRDPRGRVVAVAYLVLVPPHLARNNEELGARWVGIKHVPHLAYDHDEILRAARERLRTKLGYTNAAYSLLPSEFTMGELQGLYECVLGRTFDKRNFRKKIAGLGIVKSTGKKRTQGASRPAELFRFAKRSLQVVEIV
jgi:8-oxo-dGTP diphosphatase